MNARGGTWGGAHARLRNDQAAHRRRRTAPRPAARGTGPRCAPLEARTEWLFRLTADRDPGEQLTEHEALFAHIAAGDRNAAAACAFAHVAAGRAPSLALAASWSTPDVDPELIARRRRRTKSETSPTG
ncbi:hypothetical protein [Nocardia sp. NPDC127526]|uniref:hypothetical protein n=1 Tax=Nocardia sp. NPDC127526 TaxID=3345393 RepID=UPI00362AE969